MGITGSDLIGETDADVETRLALGIGKCRLALCVPEESVYTSPSQLGGHRVATSFPRITEHFFRQHQAEVQLVPISGSVEVMIALGVADALVDLVETGSTLAANRLRILDELGQYETVLIQNRQRRLSEVADRVVRRLEGVVIARAYSLLEYNVPVEKLAEAEQITPGFKSPTPVSPVHVARVGPHLADERLVRGRYVLDRPAQRRNTLQHDRGRIDGADVEGSRAEDRYRSQSLPATLIGFGQLVG